MTYNLEQIKNKLNKLNTIFFDLDGTIVDTEKIYFRFWKEASKIYGYELKDEEALNLRSREHKSAKEYIEHVSNGKLDFDIVRNKRIELMKEYFLDYPIELKEGAKELLTKLNSEGKYIYIVSANEANKTWNILKKTNIDYLVKDVISSKDVKRGKPFPDVYLKACQLAGVRPQDVLTFEDAPCGLKSSYDAGCFTVMVEDIDQYNDNIDYVSGAVSSLKELL